MRLGLRLTNRPGPLRVPGWHSNPRQAQTGPRSAPAGVRLAGLLPWLVMPQADTARAAMPPCAPKAAQRVFVGKTPDRVASVLLADGQGRNRLALRVDADGRASIEFLDADGKVVQRVGPSAPR